MSGSRIVIPVTLFLLAVGLSPSAHAVEVSGKDAQAGYLVQLQLQPDGDVGQHRLTRISRFDERPISMAPAQWQALVTDNDNKTLWERPIPSPNLQHIPYRPDGSKEFSFRIPEIKDAASVSIEDESGRMRWQLPLNQETLASAKARQSQIKNLISNARPSAEASKSNDNAALKQMLHAHHTVPAPRGSSALEPPPPTDEWRSSGKATQQQRRHLTHAENHGSHDVASHKPFKQAQPEPRRSSLTPPARAKAHDDHPSRVLMQELAPTQRIPYSSTSASGPTLTGSGKKAQSSIDSEAVSLTGEVVTEDGKDFERPFQMAIYKAGNFERFEMINQSGSFVISMDSGVDYLLFLLSPVPYQRVGFDVNLSEDSQQTFELPVGAVVSGTVSTSDGEAFEEHFNVFPYPQQNNSPVWSYSVNPSGDYEVVLTPEQEYRLHFDPPFPYLEIDHYISTDTNTTLDLEAERGEAVTGQVKTEDGNPLPDSFWIWIYKDQQWIKSVFVNQEGNFKAAVEPGTYKFVFNAPKPYLKLEETYEITNDKNIEITLNKGAIITGVAETDDGEELPESFRLSVYHENEWLKSETVSANGHFSIALAPDTYQFAFEAPPPYFQKEKTIEVSKDQEIDVVLIRGLHLTGETTTTDDRTLSAAFWLYFYKGDERETAARVEKSGNFEAVLEAGSYRLEAQPPSPYLPVDLNLDISGDRHVDLLLQRGRLITLDVQNAQGSKENIRRAHLIQSETRRNVWNVSSPIELVVEPGREAIISIEPENSKLDVTNVSIDQGSQDLWLDVVLEELTTLKGKTIDSEGRAMPWAELRFYKDGKFVDSVLSINDGTYNIPLPKGEYEARAVLPESGRYNSELNAYLLYDETRETLTLTEGDSEQQDFVFDKALHSLTLKRPEGSVTGGRVKVYVFKDDQLLAASAVRLNRELLIAQGTYELEVQIPGFQRIKIEELDVSGDTVVDLAPYMDGEQRIWSGVLRDGQGEPMPDVTYRIYDGAQVYLGQRNTDKQGKFTLPVGPGLFAEFGGGSGFPIDGELVKKTVGLDRNESSIQEDITLASLEFVDDSTSSPELRHVYGNGDTEGAINVLFLADGYTDISESFEDVNGNGVWDGVLYIDYNGNGVWDQGEPVRPYGDRSWPSNDKSGQDVGSDNEPFDDINGDGYPNFNDRAVFEANVRSYIRATLGSHVWEDHSDQFNFYAHFMVSNQSGVSAYNAEDELLIERDTLLNGRVHLARNTLSADYNRAREIAAEVLPEYDQIVLLLNQPVPVGRANSFVTYNGGMQANWSTSRTPAHEFGHSIAFLSDEYMEVGAFPDFYRGVEPAGVNVTTIKGPESHPWKRWMDDAGKTREPAIRGSEGVGLFTGGFYRPGGVFRPSQSSMMGSGGVLFNPPSEHAARKAIANPVTLTGAWFDADSPGQGFNFQYSSSGFTGYYYGYDNEGENLWLVFDVYDGPFRLGQKVELEVVAPASGVFNAPGDVEFWGHLTLQIESCDEANARLASKQGEHQQSFELKLVSSIPGVDSIACFQVPEETNTTTDLTGSWFDPATSGQGWNFLGTPNGLLGYFYGYDGDGNAMWLSTNGLLKDVRIGEPITIGLLRGSGGSFKEPVKPANMELWGEATFMFEGCRSGYAVIEGRDGEMTNELTMFADMAGLPACQE